MKRNVIVKFLGNDLASDKNWMIKNLVDLLSMNKLNRKVTLFEAKLYKVEQFLFSLLSLGNVNVVMFFL